MAVTVTQYGSRQTIADSTEDAVRQCPYIPGFAISPTTGTWVCSFGLTEGDVLTVTRPWPQRIKRSTNQGGSWSTITDLIGSYPAGYLQITSDGNVEYVSNWQGNGPAFVATYNVVNPRSPSVNGQSAYQPGWAYTAYSVSYDDGLTWSPQARLDTLIGFSAGANGNNYYADGDYYYIGAGPICELADGTLLYATYNKMSTVWANNFIYESRVWQSTDHGATWSQLSVPFAHDASHPQYSWEEPVIEQLADGSVLCLARTNLNGVPCVSARKSTDGGATWGTATIPAIGGVVGQISGSNRPNFGQSPGGLVLAILRAHVGSSWASDRPLYAFSPDGLTGWSGLYDVETGALAPNVLSGTYLPSFHGRWRRIGPVNTPGNMALIYAVGAYTGATYMRRFTVTGETLPTPGLSVTPATETDAAQPLTYGLRTSGLTLDPDAFWHQSGTVLTVHAAAGRRREVTGIVTSSTGGPFALHGPDAADFEVSLNGTDWAPSVIVPAGETPIWLSAQPAASGAISAELGVPA